MKCNLSLLLVVTIACLACSELVAVNADIPVFPGGIRAFDRTLGWKLERNRNLQRNKELFVELNNEGFRDLNYSKTRTPGVRRIAVIGDSFSEAMQVNLQQTYWHLLGENLAQSLPGTRWEVLNFGVGDYGTTQEYLTLKNYVLDYSPDIIILQIFPLNDVLNNSLFGSWLISSTDDFRPYLNPQRQYSEITYVNPIRSFLRNHSHFFLLVEHAFIRWGIWTNTRTVEYQHEKMEQTTVKYNLANNKKDLSAIGVNTFADESFQIPAVKEGWIATEFALKLIAEVCREKHIAWFAFSIPHEVQFNPAIKFTQMRYPFDFSSAEKRINGFLKIQGVPSMGLLEIFKQNYAAILPGIDGHLSKAGHRLVAKQLTESLIASFPNLKNDQIATN